MAIKGGKRLGAGRKKGVQNKVNAIVRKEALKSGASPLEVLLGIMRQPEPIQQPKEDVLVFLARWKYWADQRLEAAKAAAPFLHPRLATVEQSTQHRERIEHIWNVRVVHVRKTPENQMAEIKQIDGQGYKGSA